MIYPYECDKCGTEEDIFKLSSLSARIEHCPNCAYPMRRVYGSPSIKTRDGKKSSVPKEKK